MKISTVTVTYNSAATLAYTIESFLAQTYKNSELVIVDGASTDESLAMAQRYGDPRIRIFSEPDRGIFDAMNKGLALYTGDAIGYLNSDDRYHDRDALGRIAEGLRTHDIVYGNLDFVRDHKSRTVVRRWRGTPHKSGAFRTGWMPAHPTFYIRRAVADRVGFFDTKFKVAADYDFMLRAMEAAQTRSRFIGHVLIDMMAGGNSTRSWNAYLRGNVESLLSRRRWLGSGMFDYALVAKPARKIWQFLT